MVADPRNVIALCLPDFTVGLPRTPALANQFTLALFEFAFAGVMGLSL
jgi:hypothetical protein